MVLPSAAEKEGEGIHAGITIKSAEDNDPSHGDRGNGQETENGTISLTPVPEISRDDQPDEQKDRNKTGDTPRNITHVPGLKNQSGGEHGASSENETGVPPGWVRNPNKVRDAVHTLLAMENRTGGIGPQISAIAREFNNSAGTRQQDEDRITNQDAISRFFFGGDRGAAAELANLTVENQARISEIEDLMNTTTLDAGTRAVMDEQIQLLQQNVAFDRQLAAKAQQDRGILGWLGLS